VSSFSQLLQKPEPHAHFVQLYDQDAGLLARNVAQYLADGLQRNEGALVIATPEHGVQFVLELEKRGVNTGRAIAHSRLLFLDATRTLGEFMLGGMPDWKRFERVISAAVRNLQAAGPMGLRAYGEMVGVLWTAGEYSAAIRLEEFWNKLLEAGGFSLFCSYPIDIFARDFRIEGVDALLCDHTHLVPTGSEEALESAIDRAMDERLGARADGLRRIMTENFRPSWARLPRPEAKILWLRNNLPNEAAEDILGLARRYYHSCQPAASSSS
jgi:hypothetical protein